MGIVGWRLTLELTFDDKVNTPDFPLRPYRCGQPAKQIDGEQAWGDELRGSIPWLPCRRRRERAIHALQFGVAQPATTIASAGQ
jgi:hypothetical protein